MRTSAATRKSLTDAKTTTVFVSGNSQAVRLPKEFRVTAKTVEIFRRGDEIVLRERPRTVGDVLADLPALTKDDAVEFDVMMKSVRAGLPAVEERNFSWMEKAATKTGTKTRRSR